MGSQDRVTDVHQVPVDEQTDGPGMSHIDAGDPAAPMYQLLDAMRTPVTLRDTMILPVRQGYIGQDRPAPPVNLPPSGADLFPNIVVTEILIPSSAGPIRCQVYRPAGDIGKPARPMIVYIHGGGFMVGRSEDTDFLTRKMAAQNDLVLISVNCRLAPEFPFPAGLDDFVAVYRWVSQRGTNLAAIPA